MKRFTVFRKNMDHRETHNENQKNPENEPQFEGVIWSDGTATMRWLTPIGSHSVWDSIGDLLKVHGHPEYGTIIEWHDSPPPIEWTKLLVQAYEREVESE